MTGEIFLHASGVQLVPGAVILPGNFGRVILGTGVTHKLYKREILLEETRRKHFPEKPSRLRSCFVCPTFEDMDWFFRNHFYGCACYEVQLLQSTAPRHLAFVSCLPSDKSKPFYPDEEMAYFYWAGVWPEKLGELPRAQELIVSSPLKILDRYPSEFDIASNNAWANLQARLDQE
ncbi:DUF2441 domain-containing protein [Deinococcus misasensis]|uniref:DUF2441 domain-containing protein n=1 Tax=Deinococcus misasensis TaxID=392413 RepID=UPI00068CA97F|nr:DUF2441 domain-containing protein [Deinococcus misasensis]